MEQETAPELFYTGVWDRAYEYFGCHRQASGYTFRVWAPNARSVQVVGRWNGWAQDAPAMTALPGGVWELTVPQAQQFDEYKFAILQADGARVLKADPYGRHMCTRPATASRVWDPTPYAWTDDVWIRGRKPPLDQPVNIYEVHLGSWDRYPDGNPYSYRDLAERLIPYAAGLGYTHLELLPVMEHPYDPSWGYEITGFFAPTSRFGTPEDLMYFIDCCHNAGLGVILDWVGAHFPKDQHGLYQFDGTCLYEYADPLRREHPGWDTRVFDFGKPEVRSFLISNAAYWLRDYHVDGLRLDAVAAMLYLDYCRRPDQWRPGPAGDNIDHAAVTLLQAINRTAFAINPQALMIAEESTTYPMVTKPDYDGGLGFNFKWNMGWMHDTLDYMHTPPEERPGEHRLLTFPMTYAFSENFLLALSHDEVVHGKLSLLGRMPGDYDQAFSNLRMLYAWLMTQPGKKLLFMGGELGQFIEWDHRRPLDWFLLEHTRHRQLQDYVKALNRLYLDSPALWQRDTGWDGFLWLVPDDVRQSVAVYCRRSEKETLLAAFNFSGTTQVDYRIGIPEPGRLEPLLSSDEVQFGGCGTAAMPSAALFGPLHGHAQSLSLTLPALSAALYRFIPESGKVACMPMIKKDCVAMLLAGGQGSRLEVLTQATAKPALPFGGKYRIIDFSLSGCARSGIDTVGILTQYQPLELHAYIGNGQSWDLNRSFGGVQLLPPYTRTAGSQWYNGTANAIYQNFPFLDRFQPRFVLVLSGDHIYRMNYAKLLQRHRDTGAVCTLAVSRVSEADAPRMGIVKLNEADRVVGFEEKPEHPSSLDASMGVYVFTWPVLRSYLEKDEAETDSSHDFGRDLIPKLLLDDQPVYAYRFSGYWKDVGTLESLWQANMDLLDPSDPLELRQNSAPVYTRSSALPPCIIKPGALLNNCFTADGCVVYGTLEHTILSTGCRVEPGAVLRSSVVMPGCTLHSGAVVEYAILGEGCELGADAHVGELGRALTVLGHQQSIEAGKAVPPGEIL